MDDEEEPGMIPIKKTASASKKENPGGSKIGSIRAGFSLAVKRKVAESKETSSPQTVPVSAAYVPPTPSTGAQEEDGPGMIVLKKPLPRGTAPVQSSRPAPATAANMPQASPATKRLSKVASLRTSFSKASPSPVVSPSLSSSNRPEITPKTPSSSAKATPSTSVEGGSKRASQSDQLKQIRRNWDTSYVPRGKVADRIKAFTSSKTTPTEEELALENTGRTNPALRKRRILEKQQEEERRIHMEEHNRFGRVKALKLAAAIKIQSIMRMRLAKQIADHKAGSASNRAKRGKEHEAAARIQAIARARVAREEYAKLYAADADRRERARRRALGQSEFDEQMEAAIRIQAMVRSALTRTRVCNMVEEMIANLLKMQKLEEKQQKEAEEEAAALAAASLAKKKAEEDRLAEAAEARKNRELSTMEKLRLKAEQKERAEAERLRLLEEEKARKFEAAQERERRRGRNKFVGPLPWGVALLPDWWLENVPHKLLMLDSICEEDNGEDFEDWRSGNVETPVY